MGVKQKGFTLIELLVVIVVVGILAAFVVSTIFKTQFLAQESSVQTDMKSIARQVGVYQAEFGRYPTATQLQDLGVYVNKQTYGVNPSGATIFYCSNTAGSDFSIVARVKSARLMRYSSADQQIITYSGSTTAPQLCLDSGVSGTTSSVNYTGFTENGTWHGWVRG